MIFLAWGLLALGGAYAVFELALLIGLRASNSSLGTVVRALAFALLVVIIWTLLIDYLSPLSLTIEVAQ